MGPGQKILTQVRSGQPSMALFGKFPLKMLNFSIYFPSGQKNLFRSGKKVPRSNGGQPLIFCGSKVCSGWVRAHLY